MRADYILTSFSPAMLGDDSLVNFRIIPHSEALEMVDKSTRLLATRAPHDKLARSLFPRLSSKTIRFVTLDKTTKAIFIRYWGPPVKNGEVPPSGQVTYYLINVV